MKTAELRNLIMALGGPKVVGRELGITGPAVSHWKQVPPEHVMRVSEMAKRRKIRRSDGTTYTVAVLRPDMLLGIARIKKVPDTVPVTRVALD